jgi:nucleotide-binding universal stress UspA family protein
MKNVLIPTDFSENSHNALRYALDYFADIPVNFYILHVSLKTPHYQDEEPEGFFEEFAENHTIHSPGALLKEELKTCRLLAKNPNHVFYPLHENILLVEAIRKYVSEKEIHYILMGTKGSSKMNRNEIGSNTSEVITKVKCPVLVIPEHAKFTKIKNVAFPTDYNCMYKNRVIDTIYETLKLQKAALRILNIKSTNHEFTHTQMENKGFLQDFLKETKHSFHFLESKNIEAGIQEFVETWEIDMIAMVAKNLNFIQRLLFRPTVKSISYHTKIPFLVLHE